MKPLRTLVFAAWALGLFLAAAGAAFGQDDSTASEFWPETDIWWRVSPVLRFSSFIALSRNLETDYREGSALVQVDYAFGEIKHIPRRRLVDETRAQKMKRFLVRGGYISGRSLDDSGEAYRENSAIAEIHFRTPFKHSILVSHRLRTDLRWLGADPTFSTRVRYRLMVEKECPLGSTSIVPYVSGEAYYDSRYDVINRFRLIGGASVSASRTFAVEANVTYQRDSRSSVTNLTAINLILHIYFETGRTRTK